MLDCLGLHLELERIVAEAIRGAHPDPGVPGAAITRSTTQFIAGVCTTESASYTAFKVASSGRYMPYWGGRGNAKQWDDNARGAGIPVDSNPRSGDVGISNNGVYGHSFYVEQVAGDGSIYISDYNQQFDGRYREYWVSAETVRFRGLVFIHFP